VSADIFYDTKALEPAAVLTNIFEAKDVGEALAAYEPHAAEYLALKAKLAEIRAGRSGTSKPRIPNGPSLNVACRTNESRCCGCGSASRAKPVRSTTGHSPTP
jgi:murein L,D-transpeptidase YcbB/YkuD